MTCNRKSDACRHTGLHLLLSRFCKEQCKPDRRSSLTTRFWASPLVGLHSAQMKARYEAAEAYVKQSDWGLRAMCTPLGHELLSKHAERSCDQTENTQQFTYMHKTLWPKCTFPLISDLTSTLYSHVKHIMPVLHGELGRVAAGWTGAHIGSQQQCTGWACVREHTTQMVSATATPKFDVMNASL